MLDAIHLVPAVMAASFVLILVFGKRIKGGQGAARYIGVPPSSRPWVMSVAAAVQWINRSEDAIAGHAEARAGGASTPGERCRGPAWCWPAPGTPPRRPPRPPTTAPRR